ncbi:hypothetical protein ABKV19_001432 [Rosa sericea]
MKAGSLSLCGLRHSRTTSLLDLLSLSLMNFWLKYRARGQLILLLETWFDSEIFKLGYKSMLKLQASVNSGGAFECQVLQL